MAATSIRYPKGHTFFDDSGNLLASGTITYYRADTTTAQNIYSDADGLTALPNPITLNSAGRAVDGSGALTAIYLSDAGTFDYREVVATSAGTVLWTDDNIPIPVDLTASLSDFAKPRIQFSTDTAASVSLTAGMLGGGRLASSGSNSITYAPIAASTAGNGNGYLIKKTSASNTVTFDPDGSDTVDGAATFAWTADDRAYWFISDGANWHVSLAYLSTIAAGDLPAASDTASGAIELAIQSEMETATDVVRAVVPGRQHFHPGHPKCWGYVTVSAGAPTLQASYNLTSITDGGAGLLTATIATDFSSVNYAAKVSIQNTGNIQICAINAQAAGTIDFINKNSASANSDPEAWAFSAHGDQA